MDKTTGVMKKQIQSLSITLQNQVQMMDLLKTNTDSKLNSVKRDVAQQDTTVTNIRVDVSRIENSLLQKLTAMNGTIYTAMDKLSMSQGPQGPRGYNGTQVRTPSHLKNMHGRYCSFGILIIVILPYYG